MQIDRYTKIVLTGILGCLLWLCAMHSGTPLDAQIGPTPVILAGYQTTGGVKSIELGVPVLMLSPTAAHVTPPASRGETAPLPLTGGPAAPPTAAATAPRPATPPDQRQRCAATTQKGSQCSRLAQAGSHYCWQHGK